jgi:hypothetical protein
MAENTPKRRWGSRGARIGWALGFLLVVTASLWTRFDPWLRREARSSLESLLASLLLGEVHIDRVARLTLGGIEAEGVTVLDPGGRRVLYAKQLSLGLNAFALSTGTLHFTHGTLKDVSLLAIPSQHAAITLFDALSPEPSDEPGSAEGSSWLTVLFDHIHVERATLQGSVPGLANLSAKNLEARGKIRVDDQLHVTVSEAKSEVVAPYERPLALKGTTLQLDTGPLRIETHFRVAQGREQVRGMLVYKLPSSEAPQPAAATVDDALDLVLELAPISADLLLNLGVTVAQVLVPDLRGYVRLSGATRALAYRAALQSDAGPISVSGTLPEGGGVDLHFQSSGLALDRLIAYFPNVSLSLRVSAVGGPNEPARISIAAPTLNILGLGMHDAQVSGRYANDRFHFNDARVHYAGGRFDIAGWVDNDADLYVRLRANVPDVGRDPFVRRMGLSAGIVSDVQVAKAGYDLSFEGKLSVSHLRYKALVADALELVGEADFAESLERPKLRLKGKGSNVFIASYPLGQLNFTGTGKGGHYDGTLEARGSDGRTFSLALGYEERGARQHFVAHRFELRLPHRDPWRAEADVTLTPDGVEIAGVTLRNADQHLNMSGSFSYSKAYRVDALLSHFDLGGLRELIGVDLADLDGTVDGKLALTGVPKHPRIDAEATLKNGQFLGMQNLELTLGLIFAEGRFDLNTALRLPDGSTLALYTGGEPGQGDTWLDQIAAGNYQFGLDFKNVPFAVSKPWLGWLGIEPPPGTLSAMVRGAGSLHDPTLEIESEVRGLVLDGYDKLDIDMLLSHDGQKLALSKLHVADSRGPLVDISGSLSGSLSELVDIAALRASLGTREFDVKLSTPRRRLDELPAALRVDVPMPAILSAHLAQSAQGPTLALDALVGFPTAGSGIAACDGTFRRPELGIKAASSGDEARGTVEIKLDGDRLGGAKLLAEFPLKAWLTGERELSPPRTQLSADLATLASEELPVLCNYVAGPVSVKMSAEDAFSRPPNLRFTLSSSALQLAPHESQRQRLGALRNTRTMGKPFAAELSLSIEAQRVLFRGHMQQEQGSLSLSGSLPGAAFSQPESWPEGPLPVDILLSAKNAELAPFSIALPIPVRSAGALNGSARLRYDLRGEAPTLSGGLSLNHGSLVITPLGQQLSSVEARLRFERNVVRIERLSMNDFGGKFEGSGEIALDTLAKARLELGLSFKDFPLRNEGALVSKLTGKLLLRAEVDPDKTRAELTVKDLRVNLPSDLGMGLQDLDPHPSIAVIGEERPPPPEAPHLFELRVLAQKPPFRVLRSDLNAEVFTDITARYENPTLTLEGSAELKRGNFELYGRRFELQESRISFDHGDQLDPLVSLHATHKTGNAEIGVRVEGRLSAPKLSFTHSNPAITDTGTIIAALLGVRSGDPAVQNADASGAAAGMLAGATAGLLTERVRRELGGAVPVISMDPSGRGLRSTRIRAGLQLDQVIEKRLGNLRKIVRGAYVEGFVAPGATPGQTDNPHVPPQSRGGGLLELRFPADMVGSVEYRPVQNWRVDVAWEP